MHVHLLDDKCVIIFIIIALIYSSSQYGKKQLRLNSILLLFKFTYNNRLT